MAFDFRRGILSLGAHRQEMHELNVVIEHRIRVGLFVLGTHAFDKIRQISFLVDHQHVFGCHQLQGDRCSEDRLVHLDRLPPP